MDLSRREFVAGLTASCFLCGCSSEEKTQEPANPPSDQPAGGGTEKPPGELVETPAAIRAPGDQARVTLASGAIVLIWKDQVGLHATEGRCTHKRGQLFYDKDRNDIWCEEHGSRFFVDGAVEKPPAKAPLKRYDVGIEGEKLRITPRS
ncbi:MAG: Rieske Fe-S [Planctomycetota bacterium]|nr:MAG: Rieske Fe-S [Planctomycetota bacterium]